ncbi:MAG: HI0074 family nucleotidyltransferase substrate-binding subunit [Rubrivivax sp.]|nr:HI0074 family nucleotidyltransferase substrate-binding subunit [Rubrivivax sp.]
MDERFEDQREQFERALARLHEVLRENETGIVRDALIQRFEFTFEMTWRCLHRYLATKGERVAQQAWAVLPVAFQSQLIDDADVWDQLRECRNLTSHTYKEALAVQVAAFVRGPGVAAFDRLSARLSQP